MPQDASRDLKRPQEAVSLNSKGPLKNKNVSNELSQIKGIKVDLSRKRENILSHDTMMNMLRGIFRYVSAPGEIQVREARETFIGDRRFLDVDVQGIDGLWHLKRIYIRAQPSREIFKCDIPFRERRDSSGPGAPEDFSKNSRERTRRRNVLIAPRLSSSGRNRIIERGYEAWRCYVVWKPRLRTQGNRTKCKISLDWLKAYRDLVRVVRWFFEVVAARIRRSRWGAPRPQKERIPGVKLVSFMRPGSGPPPHQAKPPPRRGIGDRS